MIVSTFRKSYDTADGSEQRFDGRCTTPVDRSQARIARQRWADDGGTSGERPESAAPLVLHKPRWSVLSVAALNEAIAQNQRAQSHFRLKESERAAHANASALAARTEAMAAAHRDRYRNAWENT